MVNFCLYLRVSVSFSNIFVVFTLNKLVIKLFLLFSIDKLVNLFILFLFYCIQFPFESIIDIITVFSLCM